MLVPLLLIGCAQSVALGVGRRAVVRSFGTVVLPAALAASAAAAPEGDAAPSTQGLLRQARSQLDPCAQLIDDGNWDGVRTVVKTPPLANVRALSTKLADELGEAGEDIVVSREDCVQALQMLDTFVYNNNFINEQNGQGKRGAGVKIDRVTPLGYLGEAKDALDAILKTGTAAPKAS